MLARRVFSQAEREFLHCHSHNDKQPVKVVQKNVTFLQSQKQCVSHSQNLPPTFCFPKHEATMIWNYLTVRSSR